MSLEVHASVKASAVDHDPFAGAAVARAVPTTEPQREVWLADRMAPEASLAYNESVSLRLRGTLDERALRSAVQDLADRHESLRSTLSGSGEELLVLAQLDIPLALHDLGERSAAEKNLTARLGCVVREPFDLENGPLFRAELHRIAPDEHVLVLTAHHIVCDGWSFGVLTEELAALYAKRLDPASPAPADAPSFCDFAVEHSGPGAAERSRPHDDFWLARFPGALPVLELPVDRPRPPTRTTRAGRVDHMLDAALVAGLRRMGGKEGASLFATLFAGYMTLMRRLSGQTDVVVGIASAGQSAEGWNALVGHCVNILPVRLDATGEEGFDAMLRATSSALLDAFEHQDFTYGTLLRKLAVKRDPSRLPLVSVLFNLDQRVDSERIRFPGLEFELSANARAYENFELFVNAVPLREGVRLEAQFNADLYDEQSVRRWLGAYEAMLRSAAADPKARWQALGWLTDGARQELEALQPAPVALPSQDPVHERFMAQARAEPDRIALAFGDHPMTYGELDRRSNAIAHALARSGVGPGSLVGLCLLREPDLYASVFGVLKAGAAFVPLDPAYPKDRLNFMVGDSGMTLLVSKRELVDRVDTERRLLLDEDLDAAAWARTEPVKHDAPFPARSPAYVIYTSGSTGKPKGVVVHHHGLANLLHAMGGRLGLTPEDRLVAVTTMSFDMSIPELFLPLVMGARVVVATRENARDGESLGALLESSGATAMQATPSGWRVLLDAGWPGNPRFRALAGGEPVPQALAEALLARCGEVWNMYGPTETTVWSTCDRFGSFARGVSIGTPLANNTVWIVDAAGQPCPVGVPGEIWIGGEQVTLGYLNRPELNAERFLPDPFSKQAGARIYRTGDRGRWRNDGKLEHLGRLDFQVKVRGYRIELGEIEANLLSHPSVDRAVVITREDTKGDTRLAAYVVPKGPAPTADALRDHLRALIPGYMVPQHVVFLEQIPLSANGKVNRAALPAPQLAATQERDGRVPPRTDAEALVLAAIEDVLSLPGLGIHDDFFAFGGHSLLAARLGARLSRDAGLRVPLRVVFEAPTAERLAQWIESQKDKGGERRVTIARRADRSTAPLTRMQHRIWFLEELEPGRPTYNTPSAHRLRGPFDPNGFARAFAEVVRRQESLRTTIEVVDNVPVQVIHEAIDVELPVEDLRSIPEARREAELMARLEALAAEPFDLSAAPLFRARLFRTADDEHVFYFGPHHVIWDGWSFDIFYREMAALYGALRAGTQPALPELPVSYGDFATWHRDWMQGDELAAEVAHWKERLAGTLPTLDVPGDRPRPPEMSGEGGSLWVHVDPSRVEAARALGREHDATLFMVMLAAYTLTLHQLTGQRELVVGVPVRGRQVAELEPVMGFFVNALPLRLRVDPQASFAQLMAEVRTVALDAFRHPDVPFEQLVRELDVPRDRSRFPLYQALFSFQDARERETHWGDLEHDMIHVMQPGIAEDLSLWLMDRPAGLVGGLAWNADILERATAERLRMRFTHALEFALSHAHEPVASLGLPPQEAELLARWNDTRRDVEGKATVHSLVAAQASRTPERIALSGGNVRLTYAQLEARANALARELRARGARPGERVGLFVERGPDMVVAMLAVLKTGAAYVPLDPGFPHERLAFMASDAGLVAVVADSASTPVPGVESGRVVALDAMAESLARGATALEDPAGPADCAYVIYTSGTTGKPKGVQVPHRAVVNFLASMRAEPGLGMDDRLVAVTTLSFDIAVLELLLPLTTGAECVIATRDEALDPRALASLLQAARATVMQATPGTWRLLLDAGWTPAPGFKALIGGEPLPPDLAARLVAVVGELWNMYGPTETTVWSTCARVRDTTAGISIGRPIANTQVLVLDEHGRQAPIGVPGEIWIGGAGVALGYLNRPDLTAEKFRPDERSSLPGARIYRTGDRGRWRADGALEHLGRNDSQVKVRGFRIELGEIEARLAEHPGVAQAVVVAREDIPGDVRLVAYVVARGAAPGAAELRAHLQAFLPPYMLPQHTVMLAAIPLLPNGKVDRSALPAPEATAPAPRAARAAALPTTESEKQLAEIWSGLLRVSEIRVDDNFFDLGGHSLLAIQAMLQMDERTGRQIQRSRLIFETLGQIARAYDEAPAEAPRKPKGLKGMLSGLLRR